MKPTEYAYIAGILDIMARITTMETTDGTRLPLVAVSTTDTGILNYLGEVSGITPFLTHRSYDKHRCIEHCETAHEHVVSTSGRWSVSGAKATIILHNVRPFLRMQLDAAEDALEVGLVAPFKPATPAKMVELGWKVPASMKAPA